MSNPNDPNPWQIPEFNPNSNNTSSMYDPEVNEYEEAVLVQAKAIA